MDSNRKSEAWKHFELLPATPGTKRSVQCKLCKCKLIYSGSTSTMNSHLKTKHASVFTGPGVQGQPVQGKLNFYKRPNTMPKPRWQQITKSIVEFCASDLRPLSIVNGEGFRNMVYNLEPTYNVPSHTTIRNYTRLYYEGLKGLVKAEVNAASSISLTTDAWTSCATEGYVTVTVHYIDENWQLKHGVLTTCEVLERHTSEHLADVLRATLNTFDISETKIASITTDNASNIVSGIRMLKWTHIRCFGHTLQLSVNSGLRLSAISRATGAARKLVTHFRKSVVASNELKKRQMQLNLPEHPLIQDVPTRWNSTYFMYDRLLEQRLAVFAVLHDQKVTSPSDARVFELSDEVWRIMEELTPILKPLQIATTIACSEEFPTLSIIYPIVTGLLQNHLSDSETDSNMLKDFKKAVSADLLKRYPQGDDKQLCSQPYIIAAAMDPRYKTLKFLTPEKRELVWQNILSMLEQSALTRRPCGSETEEPECAIGPVDTSNVNISASPSTQDEPTCMSPQSSSSSQPENFTPQIKRSKLEKSNYAMEFLLGSFFEGCDAGQNLKPMEELASYRDTRGSSIDVSPTDWWKANNDRFPLLAQIARKYLGIPGTSVPSERIFSATGNLITKNRSSLDPETVNEIIFIRENCKQKGLAARQVPATISSQQAVHVTNVSSSRPAASTSQSSESGLSRDLPGRAENAHLTLPPLPSLSTESEF